MPFRYRLEPLLRLQRSLERQEEQRLLVCAARVAAIRRQIQDWEAARTARRQQTVAELAGGVPALVIAIAATWDHAVLLRLAALDTDLREAEAARLAQWECLRQQRQKREVLETLRERQQTTYDLEERRKLQQSLDDMHLIRTAHQIDRN